MKSLKKTRRIQMLAIAGLALTGVLIVLWFLPKDSFQFFMSPSEIAENPPEPTQLLRIGGLVVEQSLVVGEGETITFQITDGGATVDAAYTGIRPDLFSEGQGVVALGHLVNDVFQATEILAKHDENYMPKEVIDALKEQGVFQPNE